MKSWPIFFIVLALLATLIGAISLFTFTGNIFYTANHVFAETGLMGGAFFSLIAVFLFLLQKKSAKKEMSTTTFNRSLVEIPKVISRGPRKTRRTRRSPDHISVHRGGLNQAIRPLIISD